MYRDLKISVVIAAAGSGTRMGGDGKMFIEVAGIPVLARTALAFEQMAETDEIVIVCRSGEEARCRTEVVQRYGLQKVTAVVQGGGERCDSVKLALAAVAQDADIILIQDGARPFVTPELVRRVIAGAAECGAAVPGVPVKDTVKLTVRSGGATPWQAAAGERVQPAEPAAGDRLPADDTGGRLVVAKTLQRPALRAVQTPQGFGALLIRAAYEQASEISGAMEKMTDDASLVEAMGHEVEIVEGDERNIKITTAPDLILAARFAAEADQSLADEAEASRGITPAEPGAVPQQQFRSGFGYDVHAFAQGRKLVLGGVEIPHDQGLAGHSDADVLLHAVMDAMLGAACLGDIGRHFPDSDSRYEGISSLKLLAETSRLVREAGFSVVSVDACVVAQRPRIAPHAEKMCENIASVLKISVSQINIKGTTTEGLGFTGRKEGIASYATVTLYRG